MDADEARKHTQGQRERVRVTMMMTMTPITMKSIELLSTDFTGYKLFEYVTSHNGHGTPKNIMFLSPFYR